MRLSRGIRAVSGFTGGGREWTAREERLLGTRRRCGCREAGPVAEPEAPPRRRRPRHPRRPRRGPSRPPPRNQLFRYLVVNYHTLKVVQYRRRGGAGAACGSVRETPRLACLLHRLGVYLGPLAAMGADRVLTLQLDERVGDVVPSIALRAGCGDEALWHSCLRAGQKVGFLRVAPAGCAVDVGSGGLCRLPGRCQCDYELYDRAGGSIRMRDVRKFTPGRLRDRAPLRARNGHFHFRPPPSTNSATTLTPAL
jgi:hypothetical protein